MKQTLEQTSSLEKKEFGKNVHAVLEFLRHATPGKTPRARTQVGAALRLPLPQYIKRRGEKSR